MPSSETAEILRMGPVLIPYSRFSDDSSDAGVSQERQDEMAVQAAKEEKVEVDWSLSLRDPAMSAFRGRNWKRGQLGKFLDLVEAGVVPRGSILCIERVNRLCRMPWMKQVELWKEILSKGIIIRTCMPPSRYTEANMNDLSVGCPLVIFMMLAHQESKQKSEWACDAFHRMREQTRADGTPHKLRCPAWVRQITEPHPRDPTRRVVVGYELDPGRLAVLRHIHEMAWQNCGGYQIWQWMCDNVEPWGKPWQLGTVQYLLTTRTAVGEYQPRKLDEEGRARPDGPPMKVYPAALTEDEYRRTRAALAKRKNKGGRRSPEGRVHLFAHLLYDAHDGLTMHAMTATAKKASRTYRYPTLTCRRRRWSMPEALFERSVLFALSQLKAKDVDGRQQADALSAAVERLQNERSELALDLDDLDRQLRELPRERRSPRIAARIAELEDAIRAKDAEVQQAREAADVSSRAAALDDLKTCLQRLDEIEEMPDGPAKDETRRRTRERIRGRLPFLVESLWTRAQVEDRLNKYIHVRMYLHGGEQRDWVVTVGKPKGKPLPLGDADFRAGEERGYTVPAARRQRAAQEVTI